MKKTSVFVQYVLLVGFCLAMMIFLHAKTSDLRAPKARRVSLFPSTFILKDPKMYVQSKDGRKMHQGDIILKKMFINAKVAGAMILGQIESSLRFNNPLHASSSSQCLENIILLQNDIVDGGRDVSLPCGLTIGSSITVVGKMWRSFKLEIMGPTSQTPSIMFHLNPRIVGDWSNRSIIEMNASGFRGSWGTSQRCEGWQSSEKDQLVDGKLQCEAWIEGNKTFFPFVKGMVFKLDLVVGLQGYHIELDGMHIASHPFRPGFLLEEAATLSIAGGIELEAINVSSLPSIRNSPFNEMLKAPFDSRGDVELFIGILSACNNFADRMAIRQTWMQSQSIKSIRVLVRFFVGLHSKLEVNLQLKEEADYFQDVVVLPFIDNYQLQTFKTLAICEYGLRNVSTTYIMKADDDTFVRVDAILNILKEHKNITRLYLGGFYEHSKVLRRGKWALPYEEWPNDEEVLPPYAGGPGYVISKDIAMFITHSYESGHLEVFRLEDACMGIWVNEYNKSHAVHYLDNKKFIKRGCIDGYITVHYPSIQQMRCMWAELIDGKPHCCYED